MADFESELMIWMGFATLAECLFKRRDRKVRRVIKIYRIGDKKR